MSNRTDKKAIKEAREQRDKNRAYVVQAVETGEFLDLAGFRAPIPSYDLEHPFRFVEGLVNATKLGEFDAKACTEALGRDFAKRYGSIKPPALMVRELHLGDTPCVGSTGDLNGRFTPEDGPIKSLGPVWPV